MEEANAIGILSLVEGLDMLLSGLIHSPKIMKATLHVCTDGDDFDNDDIDWDEI